MGDKRIAGGRITLTPRVDGIYDAAHSPLPDPLAGATEEELRFFTEQSDYASLSRLEIMRRLRRAEWDAASYREKAEQLQESARQRPPLYRVQEMATRMKRLRSLLDVPRRRTIPRDELVAALYDPISTFTQQPTEAGA
jgi:hypothetical protein